MNWFKCSFALLILSVFMILAIPASAQPMPAALQFIPEVQHDTSAPLPDLHRLTPAQPMPFTPKLLKVLPTGPGADAPPTPLLDAALQQGFMPQVAATLGLNFDGLGQGQYGFGIQFAPPDTNGAVGATQYVQWVNAEFAVFDKSTGALLSGPTPGNAIWAGFGGPCQANNDGDPIVQYDKIANRWIFTQFVISSQPYQQCVAVSTSSDAMGTYHRYAFAFGNNFPDYPKLGVWPDAYYISFNMFLNGQSFTGTAACAMNRNAMLIGTSASIICFQSGPAVASLLPSDLDGALQPNTGEPAFFLALGANNQSLRLWKFHADFATPSNSRFTGPTVLPVVAFTPQCFSACVSQPGTTQRLDAIGDRPMYRLAYRRFADGHESLYFNHSVQPGIRWYEIQSPNGTPTIFQQGTFAPDSNTRWMGSIAADQSGDIALGYSEASASLYPSVYFTGRAPGDPSGALQSEQLIVAGTGSQTGGISRWGDYSSMTVDPADDCTFWYTQEYIKANGSFNWSTRIANFKFPNCGADRAGGVVSLSPAKLNFMRIPIGRASPPKSVTLTNTGTGTLSISAITASGDFAVAGNTCGSQLSAGSSCIVSVTFTPTTQGTRRGTLSFTDDAPASPQSVSLTGTGGFPISPPEPKHPIRAADTSLDRLSF
jgi:centrosomal CEP192-like protein